MSSRHGVDPGRGRRAVGFLVETVSRFQANQGPLMAAGLAYFLLLSASPLFVIAIAVIGSILGREEARTTLIARIDDVFGSEAADTMLQLIRDERLLAGGLGASLIAGAVLFYGSTQAFAALQGSLDAIWGVPASDSVKKGFMQVVRSRLLAFAMVLAIGFMMLVTSMLGVIGSTLETLLDRYTSLAGQLGSWGAALAILAFRAVCLATLFKVLPARRIAWREVWAAGLFSAVLFTLGHTLIGWYVTYGGASSAYGAAGSMIVLLFAFYYMAFVVLLGAQFARVAATRAATPAA